MAIKIITEMSQFFPLLDWFCQSNILGGLGNHFQEIVIENFFFTLQNDDEKQNRNKFLFMSCALTQLPPS